MTPMQKVREAIAKRFKQFFDLHLTGPESGFQPEDLATIAIEEFGKIENQPTDDRCTECGAVHNGSSEGLPCQYVNQPTDSVSLEKCAEAAYKADQNVFDWGRNIAEQFRFRKFAKAVLDAAGVPYGD